MSSNAIRATRSVSSAGRREMACLLTRHGFAVHRDWYVEEDIWLRQGGLPPEWWRQQAGRG